MKKIYLYIFNLTNKYVLLNLLFITIIVLFINALEISRIIDQSKANFLYLIFLKIPSVTSEIIPFVIVISISFLMRNLINNNELISIRNMGLSIIDVFKPIGISIFLFGLFFLFIVNPISAKFERDFNDLTTKDFSDIYSIKFINKGIWIKNITNNGEKKYINIEKLDLETMKATNIKIFNSNSIDNKLILAKTGQIINKIFELKNIDIYDLIDEKIVNRDKMNIFINFTKSNVVDSLSNYKFIPFYKYYDHITNLKKFNLHSTEISLYYISELLKPFFLIVLGFVVMGYSGKFKRNENFFKVLFFSILIGFLIFLLKEVVSSLTTSLNLSFIFSYFIIFSLPLFVGLYQLIKIESD